MARASASIDPQIRDVLLRTADEVESDLLDVAGVTAAVIHREASELMGDPRSVAATERLVADEIRSFLDAFRKGGPLTVVNPAPETLEFVRTLARSARGLGLLLRALHIGHGSLLMALNVRLGRLGTDTETALKATQEWHYATFVWADALGQAITDAYEHERERMIRTGEAHRAQLIRTLLSGEAHDEEAAGRTLGYDLARWHTALVLWRASEDDGDLETAARELTRALGAPRPLMVPISPTVLWAWVATDDSPPHQVIAELGRFPRSDGVCTAVGEPARGATGFAASHADAQEALRVALVGRRRPGTTVVFGKVELAAMLSGDLARTRRFVRRHLGALAVEDDEHARLRATLRVYLDEHRSRQATADRLGVHVNTVGNRLRACQRMLDRDLDEHHLELHVALVLAERLGRAAFA